MKDVLLYDTTLRDGCQAEDVSFTLEDKLRIAAKLDDLGIDYIEGGYPGSNERDADFFKRVEKLKLRNAKVASFGTTRKFGIKPSQDINLKDCSRPKPRWSRWSARLGISMCVTICASARKPIWK